MAGCRDRLLRRLVGANARRARKTLGLSQEAVALESGFHRTFIGHIERGETNVSVDSLERLALALKVSAFELLEPSCLRSVSQRPHCSSLHKGEYVEILAPGNGNQSMVPSPVNKGHLTSRQLACLRRIALGDTTAEIAASLGLSPHTVEHYVTEACVRLGARTRAHAVTLAIVSGFLELPPRSDA